MDAKFLADKFATALPYSDYVKSGKPEHEQRWKQVYDVVQLTDKHKQLLSTFSRKMNILVVSGTWCGDCVQQGPLIQKIAEGRPDRIDLKWLDRDQNPDLMQHLKINAGNRVPVAIFLAEDYEQCSIFGERTLRRYRAIMHRQLGPSCPTGILPPDQNELNDTLQDWLDEVERIQWMLRLSPRLRQKYGD